MMLCNDANLIISSASINIFIWAVALLSHAACKSFGSLFAVRFILGACEGKLCLFANGD